MILAIHGNVHVNDEELMAVFIGAESLINSSPLTYQSANPHDSTPLTLNHFLHGQSGSQFATEVEEQLNSNLTKPWR